MSEEKESTKRVLDKLACAGWIQRSVICDAELVGQSRIGVSITWTKKGQERMGYLLSLISEIENASTPMSKDEWQRLKEIAQYTASQGDAGNNPPTR